MIKGIFSKYYSILIILLTLLVFSCSQDQEGINAQQSDDVELIDGLEYSVLIKWGDPISENHYFGYNNSFLALLPSADTDAKLWVNHESVNTLMVSGYSPDGDIARHRDQIRKELYQVGGTLVKIDQKASGWDVVQDPKNMRVTGAQTFPFEWQDPVKYKYEGFGTTANGSGGVTPWGTILSCEENYSLYYGDMDYTLGKYVGSEMQWESFLSKPTEHYGWIVEIDPESKQVKKQIGMGRFAHGAATVAQLTDERVVVYSSDTRPGGSIYKYISATPNRIYPGKLYVANIKSGVWRPLSYEDEVQNNTFSSELSMLLRSAEAGLLAGGTPLDHPGGIALAQEAGELMISIKGSNQGESTNGSFLKLAEENGDYESMIFQTETYLKGGTESGFSTPNQVTYDDAGNLWFCSDIPAEQLGKEGFKTFGNNGLFVIPKFGERAGKVIQVASAPMDAAFSGLTFSESGKSLFVSVSHPGATSTVGVITSHWPEGGENVPKPSVIVIEGDFLKDIKSSN